MEEWLQQVGQQAPYIVIVGVLIISGFGLPLPEDIPLLVAGYLCATGYARIEIMLPATFLAIVGADAMVYWLGRRYGHHVPKLPLLRRYLTPERVAKTEAKLHKHGGKFIFTARFLPGIRTAAFFSAGVFKVPYWKFFLYDGAAALISVPTIVLLAYYFGERVKGWVEDGSIVAIVLLAAIIGVPLLVKRLLKRRVPALDGG